MSVYLEEIVQSERSSLLLEQLQVTMDMVFSVEVLLH